MVYLFCSLKITVDKLKFSKSERNFCYISGNFILKAKKVRHYFGNVARYQRYFAFKKHTYTRRVSNKYRKFVQWLRQSLSVRWLMGHPVSCSWFVLTACQLLPRLIFFNTFLSSILLRIYYSLNVYFIANLS